MRIKQNKNFARIMALVLAGLLVFSALFSAVYMIAAAESEETADSGGTPVRTTYAIRAALRPAEQAISCEQTTVYTNETGGKLSQLFFACYANALRRQTSAPFDSADWDAAYPDGYAPGGLQFASVRAEGVEADWGVQGDDETLLRVEIDCAPDESVRIDMTYDLLLPVCSGFCGAGATDWRLTNAFPTVCPFRNGGFVMNPALSCGSFAFAEAADWSIELTAPDGWEFVASGAEACESAGEGYTKWTARVSGARDMAVALGRRYTQYGRQSETGRAITVYGDNRSAANAALEAADRALTVYEGWFGEYPYPDLDIVMSQCFADEISAPGVILLNKGLSALGAREDMEYAVALALAGQFFGESVGGDPCGEAWLSDGTAAFCALLYYRERYGEERFLKELNARVRPSLQVTIPGGVAPDSSAAYFNSRYEYELTVLGRGAAALYELFDAMGAEPFLRALGRYAADNAGLVGSFDAFARALNAEGGEWARFLADALANIGDYTLQQLDWYE